MFGIVRVDQVRKVGCRIVGVLKDGEIDRQAIGIRVIVVWREGGVVRCA